MCANDASGSPRGIKFLLDDNRINVAKFRTQTLAIVVANPKLSSTNINSVEQLRKLNLLSTVIYIFDTLDKNKLFHKTTNQLNINGLKNELTEVV